MTSLKVRHLTAEELKKFEQDGFIVARDLFDEARLDAVADEVTDVIDGIARRLVAEGKLTSTYEEYSFTSRLSRITAETEEVYTTIYSGQLSIASIFELIRTPALLDVAEQLCGPELIASSVYRIRPKMPRHQHGVVPWHQDSGYFEPFCDKSLVLTCWLPLVDATPENGCMQVIRGAHRSEVYQHGKGHSGYLEIFPDDLPAGDVVTVPVKRGDALLMTNRTPHRSIDNVTDEIRWSMDLRYQSASLPTNAPLTRLAEEDALPAHAPIACYPPEADFLIRSLKRPEQVLRSAEEFDRLRKSHQPGRMTDRWNMWSNN